MRTWTALYYPNIEPPIGWLRSAALLFDTIASFVPRESDEHLSDELLRFADTTDAWRPYRPDEQTATLLGTSLDRLDAAFRVIAERRRVPPDKLVLNFVFDGDHVRIEDHVFLHGSKMSAPVRDLLCKYRLLLPATAVPSDFIPPGDWWLVDQKASDLLLAQIADNLAARKGWASLTDDQDSYAFTSLDSSSGCSPAEGCLARLVITELIPDSIDELSNREYLELRHRYEPIRQQVVRFVTDVIHEDRLNGIRDPTELQKAAASAVRTLRTEVENFRESSNVRKWSAFGIGGLLMLVGGALPESFSVPLAGARLVVSGVEKSGVLDTKATKRRELLRLMAGLRDDILVRAP